MADNVTTTDVEMKDASYSTATSDTQTAQPQQSTSNSEENQMNDVQDVLDDYANDGLDLLEEKLLRQQCFAQRKELIQNSLGQLAEVLQKSLAQRFENFEQYTLRNLFAIPDYVDTKPQAEKPVVQQQQLWQQFHDLDIANAQQEKEFKQLGDETQALKRQLEALQNKNSLLEEQLHSLEAAAKPSSSYNPYGCIEQLHKQSESAALSLAELSENVRPIQQ